MHCETPGPAALGCSSSFTEHSVRVNPADALPGLVVPLLFYPRPLLMATHLRAESSNPLLLPRTHTAKICRATESLSRATLIHPPKASAGRTTRGTALHHRRGKSMDLHTPGQLCWHRRSLGNVRCLKIEQMFLLKGLLQCSA